MDSHTTITIHKGCTLSSKIAVPFILAEDSLYISTVDNPQFILIRGTTLPQTNIAPENWWLEDEFLFGKPYFHLVSGRVHVSIA